MEPFKKWKREEGTNNGREGGGVRGMTLALAFAC
jgi:hypothetical protein